MMKQNDWTAERMGRMLVLVVHRAKKDLVYRLSVPYSEVKLEYMVPTVHPDRSLGIAPPGSPATVTIKTPGFILYLQAGKRKFRYNTSWHRAVLCREVVDRVPERV